LVNSFNGAIDVSSVGKAELIIIFYHFNRFNIHFLLIIKNFVAHANAIPIVKY